MSVNWADLPPTGATVRKLEDENRGLRAKIDVLTDRLARLQRGFEGSEAPVNNSDVVDENAAKAVIQTLVPSEPMILSILDQRVTDAGTVDEARAAQEFRDKVQKEFEAVKDKEQQYVKCRETLQSILKQVCPYVDLDIIQERFDYVPVVAGEGREVEDYLEWVTRWLDELEYSGEGEGLCDYSTPACILFITTVSCPHRLSRRHLAGLVKSAIDSKCIERASVPLLEVLLHVIGHKSEACQETIPAKLTTFTLRALELLGALFGYAEYENGRYESLQLVFNKLIPFFDSDNLLNRVLIKRVSEGFENVWRNDGIFETSLSIGAGLLKEAKDARLDFGLEYTLVPIDEDECAVIHHAVLDKDGQGDFYSVELFSRRSVTYKVTGPDYHITVRDCDEDGEDLTTTIPIEDSLGLLGKHFHWITKEHDVQA